MTKAELVGEMAKDADITKAAAGKALQSFLDGVAGDLKKRTHLARMRTRIRPVDMNG